MLCLELPWAADKAVQQFGRVHRSNQVSGPCFKLLVTDIAAERRFVAAISRRMKQLGAMTKGDRRAALGDCDAGDLGAYDIFTRQGAEALEGLYRLQARLQERATEETKLTQAVSMMQLGQFDKRKAQAAFRNSDQASLKTFLNRLLTIPLDLQNSAFDAFTRMFEEKTMEAEVNGELDRGVRSLNDRRGDWEVVATETSREVLHKDPRTGAETYAVNVNLDTGYPWERAEAYFQRSIARSRDELEGFYQEGFWDIGRMDVRWDLEHYVLITRAPIFGSYGVVYYWLFRPTGWSNAFGGKLVTDTALLGFRQTKLRKVTLEDLGRVERGWRRQYAVSEHNCIHIQHGQRCKHRGLCQQGQRSVTASVISGNILSIIGSLQGALSCTRRHLEDHEGNAVRASGALQLTKALTQEGGRVVGIEVYDNEMASVRYTLEHMADARPSEIRESSDAELIEVLVQHVGAQPGSLATWREAHTLLARDGYVEQGGNSHRWVRQVYEGMIKERLVVKGPGGGLRPRGHEAKAQPVLQVETSDEEGGDMDFEY